ncbi:MULTISPECIES: type III-B CRISPR module RAMP protein Cmr6 [Paenibacillus]|uniref:type III-B CRISPR module RAMP protein Cmr6 n=1 Tax=Paenibacillus TaxID=44249 RepID=UPI00201E1F34|nr:type III-B CRISPR module RAMP protein Cmr6 [Paenibacillus amylolyticus]MCL6663372.1 type III-B CRISPR module RAMP protein Cmr6 [Paenibacillus amylolyticus]
MTKMTESRIYHPKDTGEILSRKPKADHLWYLLHYNQDISFDKYKNVKFGKQKKSYTKQTLVQMIQVAEAAEKRKESMLKLLESSYYFKILRLKDTSLILHGLGSSHVNESSLTIHPVYGVPYIPASSIKGVVRRWFLDALLEGEATNLATNKGIIGVLGRALFGSEDGQGIVQFYDMLFYNRLEIKLDVLTPHFGEYYANKELPSDTKNPVPNTFYAASVHSVQLMLTVDKRKLATIASELSVLPEPLMEVLSYWISAAFKELGVGSKSSSGYGRFNRSEEVYTTASEESAENLLSNMTEKEKLIFRIKYLSSSVQDIGVSKKEIYTQIIESNDIEAAQALKKYWTEIGEWVTSTKKKGSGKQADKCKTIQMMLLSN